MSIFCEILNLNFIVLCKWLILFFFIIEHMTFVVFIDQRKRMCFLRYLICIKSKICILFKVGQSYCIVVCSFYRLKQGFWYPIIKLGISHYNTVGDLIPGYPRRWNR